MKIIVLVLCIVVAATGSAVAGVKHVKAHYTSNGKLVPEHHAIEPGGEPWQYWIPLQKGQFKDPNYSQRPYGAMRLAPEGTVEPMHPSDIQDFDNDPFDTD